MTLRPAACLAALTVLAAMSAGLGGACTSPMYFFAKGTGGTAGSGAGGTGGAPTCTPGEVVDCYSGPAGTAGQGICKAGTQTCAADGAGFGACDGEQLPELEDCATPVDEDCDGLAPACKGVHLWSKRFGENPANIDAYCALADMAATASGNVVLTGYFVEDIDFGGAPLTSAGNSDIFVAMLDPDGGHVWSESFGSTGAQEAVSVAVDPSGNLLLAGYFSGSLDFGDGPMVSKGKTDVFLAKLDSAGALLWKRSFGDAEFQAPNRAVLAPSGEIVAAGTFTGSLDFGAGPLTSGPGVELFVAGLDAGATGLWNRRAGDVEQKQNIDIAVDSAGNVVVAGSFKGTLDFAQPSWPSAGGVDAFVVKLDAAGDYLWGHQFGDEAEQEIDGVAVDAKGDVYVVGTFGGTMDLGGGMLQAQGGTDILLGKLDAAGNHVWSKRFGDAQYQDGFRLAVDVGNNVVVTGIFDGVVDFGGGPLASSDSADTFLVKLDGAGEHIWSKRFGGMGISEAPVVCTDPVGNIFLGGQFNGEIDLGGGPLVNAISSANIFVGKFSP